MTTPVQQPDPASTIATVDVILKTHGLPPYTELRMKYNADTVALMFEAEMWLQNYREALTCLNAIIVDPTRAAELADQFVQSKAYASQELMHGH